MDWSEFCGCNRNTSNCSSIFTFEAVINNDLSPCLQLLLLGAASLLLLIGSFGYLVSFCKRRHDRTPKTSLLHYLTLIRCFLCVFIAGSTTTLQVTATDDFTGSDTLGSVLYYVITGVSTAAWLAMGLLLYSVRYVVQAYKRVPWPVTVLYLLNLAVFIKDFITYWCLPTQPLDQTIIMLYSVASISHVFLITSFVPVGITYANNGVLIDTNGETASLLAPDSSMTYSTFEGADLRRILVGEDGNCFSKLFFLWVHPLMKRGKLKLIKTADHVFQVRRSSSGSH